jgi:hypothetical protein
MYATMRVMPNQANTRQHVENLWISRAGNRTKLYGKGKQYRARYVDTSGKEHTQRFKYKADANEWLKGVTRQGADIAPAVTGEWSVAAQYGQWIRKADIAETTQATRRHTWNAHVEGKWGEFDTDLDALADVLGAARSKALKQSVTPRDDRESAGVNVPGTFQQTA